MPLAATRAPASGGYTGVTRVTATPASEGHTSVTPVRVSHTQSARAGGGVHDSGMTHGGVSRGTAPVVVAAAAVPAALLTGGSSDVNRKSSSGAASQILSVSEETRVTAEVRI